MNGYTDGWTNDDIKDNNVGLLRCYGTLRFKAFLLDLSSTLRLEDERQPCTPGAGSMLGWLVLERARERRILSSIGGYVIGRHAGPISPQRRPKFLGDGD
jgi:hypothetical protein